jgi:hypothetical protein
VTPGTPPGGANVAAATAALTPGTGATQADQARDLIAMIKQGLGLPPGASNEQLRQLLRDRLQTGGVRNAVLDDLLRFIKQRYGLSPLASNDRLMDHLFDIELGRADRLLDNISSGVDPNKSPISDALAAVNPAIVALQGKIADLERRLSKKEDELRNKRNERNDVWLARFSLPADLGAIVAMNGGSLDAYWTTSEAAIQALVNEYDNLYRQWREARYQLELAIQRDRTQ